jgi:hypothetical protein
MDEKLRTNQSTTPGGMDAAPPLTMPTIENKRESWAFATGISRRGGFNPNTYNASCNRFLDQGFNPSLSPSAVGQLMMGGTPFQWAPIIPPVSQEVQGMMDLPSLSPILTSNIASLPSHFSLESIQKQEPGNDSEDDAGGLPLELDESLIIRARVPPTSKDIVEYNSLKMDEKLPPMTSYVEYTLRDYDKAKTVWNAVPKVLHDLKSVAWRDRNFLKHVFRTEKGNKLQGQPFPMYLLLQCDTVEDRLKVMNWWSFLGRKRGEEWQKISGIIAEQTHSGQRLDEAKSSQRLLPLSDSEQKDNTYFLPLKRSASMSIKPDESVAEKKRVSTSPSVDLDLDEEAIIEMLQGIYGRMYEARDEAPTESLLWSDRNFRNGIMLLRHSYQYSKPIRFRNYGKVVLLCPQQNRQGEATEADCQHFTIRNHLGLRHDASPLCKACKKHDKNSKAKRQRADVSLNVWKEKCRQLHHVVQTQEKRIKSLQDAIDWYEKRRSGKGQEEDQIAI